MKQLCKIYITGLLSIALNGCMTFSGDRLSDLEPIEPMVSPRIEIAVGSSYKFMGDDLRGDSVDGKLTNDIVINELWKEKGYVSYVTVVQAGEFTSNADYNLIVSGKHWLDSHELRMGLSAFVLFLFPSPIDHKFDLTYTLENVTTGETYTASAKEDMSVTVWLPFVIALPFSFIGFDNAAEKLSEHIYQDFVKQGAFSSEQAVISIEK